MRRKVIQIMVFSIFVIVLVVMYLIIEWPSNEIEVVFCDVGQGDAILITQGFRQMLVDTGRDESVIACLSENMAFFDRKVEFVVETHADMDHVGGLPEVLKRYQVDMFISSMIGKQNDDFDDIEQAVYREQGMIIEKPFFGTEIGFSDDIKAKILSNHEVLRQEKNDIFTETMLEDSYQRIKNDQYDYNDGSIVLLLTLYNHRLLLTGDISEKVELSMVDRGVLMDVDVLKVSHHGSKTASSEEFLEVVLPEISVISCSENNNYGHPHSDVLSRIENVGSRIYRTDKKGDIKLGFDKNSIFVRE